MKKCLKYILIIFSFLIATAIFLCSCAFTPTPHNVVIFNEACIRPDFKYNFKTGNLITFEVDGKSFVIPKGFGTDLASIPRWYWTVLSPHHSDFITPSVIHDYFYRCYNDEDREFADSVFYYSLRNNGVGFYTASKFYIAVRLFGRKSYLKNISC